MPDDDDDTNDDDDRTLPAYPLLVAESRILEATERRLLVAEEQWE